MPQKEDVIQEKLLDFIIRNFMVELEEIVLDESLVDQGIIDSLGLIEINSFIQKEFSVHADEEKLNRENFGSVQRIVNFVLREMDKN